MLGLHSQEEMLSSSDRSQRAGPTHDDFLPVGMDIAGNLCLPGENALDRPMACLYSKR